MTDQTSKSNLKREIEELAEQVHQETIDYIRKNYPDYLERDDHRAFKPCPPTAATEKLAKLWITENRSRVDASCGSNAEERLDPQIRPLVFSRRKKDITINEPAPGDMVIYIATRELSRNNGIFGIGEAPIFPTLLPGQGYIISGKVPQVFSADSQGGGICVILRIKQ